MSILVSVNHKTSYTFDKLITVHPHLIRLRPAPHFQSRIRSYSLNIQPDNHFINWQQDPFSNYIARLVFPEKIKKLSIEVDLIADMSVINPFDFFIEEYADNFPFNYEHDLKVDLTPYFEIKEKGRLLKKLLKSIDKSEKKTVEFLVDLNLMLSKEINYTIRMEPGIQTCEETLEKKLGSCRDNAWLLAQILRHLGLAARFVSGYLVQLKADKKSLDGPSGPEEDFTDLHAWTEVYIPGAGWIGLDPTSGLFASEGHIPLCCTPDPLTAAPVTGSTEPCKVEFSFSNSVQRIHEDPRVSKPYTDEQWEKIYRLGQYVDQRLTENKVHLTMGGEPTFISSDNMDGSEWNFLADSDEKRELAVRLINNLKEVYSPGGVICYGQGKWYPGEILPRWKYAIYWRKDEVPVWKNPELLSNPMAKAGYDNNTAKKFILRLADNIGVDKSNIVDAYEDIFYYLWKESGIPEDLDPLDYDLKDPLERKYLASLLNNGMGEPTGFVLPLSWSYDENKWMSTRWEFRRDNLYLIPGASSMGYRLPLKSLNSKRIRKFEGDFSLFRNTGHPIEYRNNYNYNSAPQNTEEDRQIIAGTAVCLEIRKGVLYIFLPPLKGIEQFTQLLSFIEETAKELNVGVVLEGYDPPNDNRILSLSITPDPGVIEVNIFPSNNWEDMVDKFMKLYEVTHQTRLSAEKFMLDGRHTGTGGGNHITLGGVVPTKSPFLRKPSLLRSLITFWQHHPSLSYLFSGLFIGPTSQAPRVDEGRDDKLYELEIAFDQIPEGETSQLWLADRILRNFLVDLTGNTHRAEFCIDKLYSPDSESGRQGIVELRAFEMPPDAKMSLVQALLVRALISIFWQNDYKGKLVRWGTSLHDKFLLPYYSWKDICDVVEFINFSGFEFDIDWFKPFFEFRFPLAGKINVNDIELELRMAIEPWNVLGEEVTSSGTSRYVDSSAERIQIKLKGLTKSRYVVTCNKHVLPLRSTETPGEYVCGIKYLAWRPHSTLHPTIQINSPLTFDIIDTWNKRSIGGCRYHVAHPSGRNYETLPVNYYEAESRRVARFWDYNHTPGTIEVPPEYSSGGRFFNKIESGNRNEELPEFDSYDDNSHTFDLRKKR